LGEFAGRSVTKLETSSAIYRSNWRIQRRGLLF
jgi:hypothetical protein